ncbi:unnamed protein product [Peronospora belbahrii]|uniref:Uncharacterized protein n=1 Tax=Peronospora belbahrii TaxID=622444 RepID=A0ABN8CYK3_9STRA|nr:unnamed protein product [Peronospora belbahrii]
MTVPRPPTESVPLETAQYLQQEEEATLTLVAQEARSEAQDWLRKRIGQKKLLSDAHAQLQNAKKHNRTASGSSVSSNKDEIETSNLDSRDGFFQSDQQLLEELKAAAAKKFVEKHVAEAVVEARLSIEREKLTIFQETGLYLGITAISKNSTNGKRCSLFVQAATSTTGSILLPAP